MKHFIKRLRKFKYLQCTRHPENVVPQNGMAFFDSTEFAGFLGRIAQMLAQVFEQLNKFGACAIPSCGIDKYQLFNLSRGDRRHGPVHGFKVPQRLAVIPGLSQGI